MTHTVFKKVVVPVQFEPVPDGETCPGTTVTVEGSRLSVSPSTSKAIELAAGLVPDGGLCLLHVHHDFADHATWMNPAEMDELNRSATKFATSVLDAIVELLDVGASYHCRIEGGNVLDSIVSVAASESADLIVMSASGRSRVNRAITGSTADKLIRQSDLPVLVVPNTFSP